MPLKRDPLKAAKPIGHYPLDALWQPAAAIWIATTGLAIAAALALAPGINGNRFTYFGLTLLVIQWIAVLTLGALYLARNQLARLATPQVAYISVLLLFLSTWLVGSSAWLLMKGVWPEANEGWASLLLRLSGIAGAVSILALAAFRNHWNARQLAVRASQAELESLQARIHPHFLFNTLNTAIALVRRQPDEVERLLLDLADLFRAALAGPRQISLEDELALARRYLEIEALRFGDRLTVHWQLPSDIPGVTVPALSIQPLVENAIRHGVECLPGGGDVEISVSTTAGAVVVRISNPLARADSHAHHGHQVGLSASQVRIEALTDGRGSVQTHVADGRYIATVRLPIE